MTARDGYEHPVGSNRVRTEIIEQFCPGALPFLHDLLVIPITYSIFGSGRALPPFPPLIGSAVPAPLSWMSIDLNSSPLWGHAQAPSAVGSPYKPMHDGAFHEIVSQRPRRVGPVIH
jgi:hypothetical protein